MTGINIHKPFQNHVLTALLGSLFALALYPVWNLEGRWFVIAIIAIALLSLAMMFAGRLGNFLLILLLFSIPLAGFSKWLLTGDDTSVPLSGAFSIGLTDFILAGLYLTWGYRVFIVREEALPHLERIDLWVLLLVMACIMSLWGTPTPVLGFGALEHLVKHVLIYFYLSRHIRRAHLPWLVAALAIALLGEAAIGTLQNRLGILRGLILDKGAGGELLNYQYSVPGIEDLNRSTGSLYDSHALALYLAMLCPYALVFLYARHIGVRERLLAGVLLLAGLGVLVFTYSRSGWLSCALSLGVATVVLLAWRERFVAGSLYATLITAIVAGPLLLERLFARLYSAPGELLAARFEQFSVAWSIWKSHFLFGYGAGNYMRALEDYNANWAFEVPVHNAPLFIGAELGLFGVLAFYALVASVVLRLWRLVRRRREPESRLALAGLAGIAAYLFDGMSNPMFREPTVYMMFWLTAALSVALTRMAVEPLPAAQSG